MRSHGSGQFEPSQFKRLGQGVVFEAGCLVFHPENIEIDDGVYVGHYAILKGYYRGTLRIGRGTWIGQGAFLHSAGDITIGERVGIGPHVKIVTSTHDEGIAPQAVIDGALRFKPVVLADGADIGVGTVILPGVTIGAGAIVGAGSVVTKDVAAGTVVAGNPARLLRARGALPSTPPPTAPG